MVPHAPALTIEEIAERLTIAGLRPEEARVLVWLWAKGSARAGHIAQETGLNRTRVYRILNDLGDRGYVVTEGRQPIHFRATPLDTVLADLVEQGRAVITSLDRLRERLRRSPPLIDTQRPARPDVRRLTGRQDVWLMALRLVRNARHRVVYVDTHGEAAADRTEFWLELALRHRAEVTVELVLGPDFQTPPGPLATCVRKAPEVPPMRFLVVDDHEALVWILHDPYGEAGREEALLSADPGLVATQLLCCRGLVEHGSPAGPSHPMDPLRS